MYLNRVGVLLQIFHEDEGERMPPWGAWFLLRRPDQHPEKLFENS